MGEVNLKAAAGLSPARHARLGWADAAQVGSDAATYPSLIRRWISPVVVLLCIDACVAVFGLYLGYQVKFAWSESARIFNPFEQQYFQAYLQLMIAAPFVRLFAYSVFGVYRYRATYTFGRTAAQMFKGAILGTALLIILSYLGVLQFKQFLEMREFSYSRLVFGVDLAVNITLATSAHLFLHSMRTALRRRGIGLKRVAIQGSGQGAATISEELAAFPELGYRFVGFIDHEDAEHKMTAPVLGGSHEILRVVNQHKINEVVVTEPGRLDKDFLTLVQDCQQLGVTVKVVPDLRGLLYHHSAIEGLAGMPVIRVRELTIAGYSRFVKRAEDVVIAGLLLLLLSPLLLLTALAIKLDSRGPVLFLQQRIGRHGRHFGMYKFRSMYQDAEEMRKALQENNESDGPLFKMKQDPRVTRVGRLIRRMSIDELPQLLNVLKGEMSLVGPRPLPISDVADPDAWEHRRFAAVPGITGLWQVNRIAHTAEEMLKWDLYYIDNWSLWLDLRTIFVTLFVVLSRRGAY